MRALGDFQRDAIRNITGSFNGVGDALGAFRQTAHEVTNWVHWNTSNGTHDVFHTYFDASKSPGTQVGGDNRPVNTALNGFIIVK